MEVWRRLSGRLVSDVKKKEDGGWEEMGTARDVYVLAAGLVARSDRQLRKEQSSTPLKKTSISTHYEDRPAPPQKRKDPSSNLGRLLRDTRTRRRRAPSCREASFFCNWTSGSTVGTILQHSISAEKTRKQEQTTIRTGWYQRDV